MGPLRRVLMSAIALLVVYGNVAVVFNTEKLGLSGWPSLPRPFAIHDAFLIPGMFSSYTTYNFDLYIEGERTNTGRLDERQRWIELTFREFFPQRYPIAYTQLFAAHHWDMLGDEAQRATWAALARRIQRRQNLLHPEAPIQRVRFGSENFPTSSEGYRTAKVASATHREIWYSDP